MHREYEVGPKVSYNNMIPFSGTTSLKQYVPIKPNHVGFESFILANQDGLVGPTGFLFYAGKDSFLDVKRRNEKNGLGGKVIVTLAECLIPGTAIYCDRYFTSLPILSELLSMNLCTRAYKRTE